MSNSSAKYSKSATTVQNDLKLIKDQDTNRDTDSITLNLETRTESENKNINATSITPNTQPQIPPTTTPTTTTTSNSLKKYFSKRPTNLSLKIANVFTTTKAAEAAVPTTPTNAATAVAITTAAEAATTTSVATITSTAALATTTTIVPTTTTAVPTTSTTVETTTVAATTTTTMTVPTATTTVETTTVAATTTTSPLPTTTPSLPTTTSSLPTTTPPTTTPPTSPLRKTTPKRTKTAPTANTNEHYAETENATLSNTKISMTSPASSTSTSNATETTTTIFPHEQYKTMKKLDIGFTDIKFSAKASFFSTVNKDIIKGLSGVFRSGELSAIVGPSGAGKSTLLNILSAYTPHGYTGNVTVNGNLRDIKAFKPNLAFITQDTSLQPYLTVKEAMHFSANLKIGTHMSKASKRERVRKILEAIGIYENRHVRTGNLSGGQKKRLAIALELVNNPPVLILDEPTSGLDSSIANQCISLLKKLAMEGRTVICTIHQPSALAFEMFDHLYAIGEGECIYSGGSQNLVPFLADLGLVCPESYNPVDYLMEIATHDYGKQNPKLVEKIDSGRNETFRQNKSSQKPQMEALDKINKMMASGLMTPVTAPILSSPGTTIQINYPPTSYQNFKQLTPINEMSSKVWDSSGFPNESPPKPQNEDKQDCNKPKKINSVPIDPTKLCRRDNIYATPFYRQLSILLLRTFLILWRDKSLTTMRFVIHFLTAVLIGFLYYGIGNDASNALNSFRYVFYTIMFIMYCAFSSILVNFPLEFPIVSREHFNRWYSLRAYYVAMTLADIPIQLICTSLFIGITYFLTDQPKELFRIALFALIVFLTALVGQSIGLAVGASLNITLGCILGPFFICPFLTFSGFFLQEKDAPGWLHWLFTSSFLKYSLDGAMLAIFGFDRAKLECHEMYCHYLRPQFFLKDLDMENADYFISVVFLVSVFLVLRIVAFYIMSFRLRLFR